MHFLLDAIVALKASAQCNYSPLPDKYAHHWKCEGCQLLERIGY